MLFRWVSRNHVLNRNFVSRWNLRPARVELEDGVVYVGSSVLHVSEMMPLEQFETRWGFSLEPGECKPISIDSVEPWGWDMINDRERERGG